jgi:hypothetical protein
VLQSARAISFEETLPRAALRLCALAGRPDDVESLQHDDRVVIEREAVF